MKLGRQKQCSLPRSYSAWPVHDAVAVNVCDCFKQTSNGGFGLFAMHRDAVENQNQEWGSSRAALLQASCSG